MVLYAACYQSRTVFWYDVVYASLLPFDRYYYLIIVKYDINKYYVIYLEISC